MGADRVKVLAWAAGSILLILVGTLVLDWFHAKLAIGVPTIDGMWIDLRSIHTCVPQGACVSVPLSTLKGGAYSTVAIPAFWGNLALAAIVAWSAIQPLRGAAVSDGLARSGYALALACFGAAALAGYMFGPESRHFQEASLTVERTWAPALVLLGDLGALAAVYFAANPALSDDGAYKPVDLPVATARTTPIPAPAPAAATPRPHPASSVPFPQESVPMRPVVRLSAPLLRAPSDSGVATPRTATAPIGLRGRLSYAVASAELSQAGIDARREDGAAKLVMWRDVVGVVTRRLPPVEPFDGSTFVDLVSTAGATLRILPWTKLTGEAIAGDGDDRARAVATLISARCAEAKVDPLTRKFLDGAAAAQLPDAATLAVHDQRLA